MTKHSYSLALFFALAFLGSGCTGEKIKDCCENPIVEGDLDSIHIIMPSAFSPNGDGTSDLFHPILRWTGNSQPPLVTIDSLNMKIKNASGIVIAQVDNTTGWGWDGMHNNNESPQGVYNYEVTYWSSLGNSGSLSGKCSLIRPFQNDCENFDLSSCQFEEGIILGGWDYLPVSDNAACQ